MNNIKNILTNIKTNDILKSFQRTGIPEKINYTFYGGIIMKNVNIQKINKMGKVMKILTRISMVFAIIGCVFSVIGAVCIGMIDTSNIRVNGDINAKMYISGVGKDDILTDIPDGDSISVNDEIDISSEKIAIDDFLTLYFKAEDAGSDEVCFNISSSLADDFSISKLKSSFINETIASAFMCAAIAVGMGFASALSKAVEKCETPFSEEVVRRMKNFGYSMLPYAVLGGIDGGLQLAICIIAIILMIFVFSYGVNLQTENDEMV